MEMILPDILKKEENGDRDSEIPPVFQSPYPHSPRGFAARLSKTLFRVRLQYRQLRRLKLGVLMGFPHISNAVFVIFL